MKIDTGKSDPDHTLIPIIIEAQSITTHTEATPDHTMGLNKDMTGAAHDPHTHPLTNIDNRSHSHPAYTSSRRDPHQSTSHSSRP